MNDDFEKTRRNESTVTVSGKVGGTSKTRSTSSLVWIGMGAAVIALGVFALAGVLIIPALITANRPAGVATTDWPTLAAQTDPGSPLPPTPATSSAATPTPVLAPTVARTHEVQPDETLASIALLYGISIQQLMAANGLDDPDYVQAGAVLVIPVPGELTTPEMTASAVPPTRSGEPDAIQNPLAPYSVDSLTTRQYPASQIILGQQTALTSEYREVEFSYTSDGIYVTGLMHIPRNQGTGPFPLIILLHGGVDQSGYSPGDGTRADAIFFVRQGYLTVAPDYRSYNDTEGSGTPLKLTWTIDVMNLIAALPSLPDADPMRIGVLGHSRGGGIATHIMVMAPQIRAVSLDAPVSTDEAENWYRYRDVFGAEWPAEDAAIYGSPESNAAGYAMISPIYYLDRVTMPVQIHHGTDDGVIPIAWSRDLFERLRVLGKDVSLFEYPGAGHGLLGDDYALYLQRNLEFFDLYVRGAGN